MSVPVDMPVALLDFLEAYPFPAFVLVTKLTPQRPPLLSRDTDATVTHVREADDVSAYALDRHAVVGRDAVPQRDGVRDFYADAVSPLSGPYAMASSSSSSSTKAATTPPPLVHVAWSNERFRQVLEHRPLADCAGSAQLEHFLAWAESDDEELFTLDVVRGGGSGGALFLAKTVLPVPGNPRAQYCILTSVRAGELAAAAGSTVTPSQRSSMSTDVSYFPAVSPPATRPTKVRQRSRQLRRASAAETETDPEILIDLHDWSSTSLGPRSHWPPAIRGLISVMMRSTTQDSLWIGPDLNLIYNKHYARLTDHPMSFGRPAREVWATVWDSLGPLFERTMQGETLHTEDGLYLYQRSQTGMPIERYHTYSLIPIIIEGKVLGVYNPSTETTDQVIAKRRLETTRDLSEQLLVARTQREYYDGIAEVTNRNTHDVPFIICYRVEEGDSVDLTLEATVGVPRGHAAAVAKLSMPTPGKQRVNFGLNADRLSSPTLSAISALSSGSGGHRISKSQESGFWPIAKALATRQVVLMEDCGELIRGFPIRQWDQLPTSALVVPICSESTTEMPSGIAIIGLNAFRPFDHVYEDWIQVMRAHLTSSLASVKAYEAEVAMLLDKDRIERAKNAWFQGAAHDLRSPLTLVAGPLDDVLRSALTPDQKAALSLASRNVHRLQRLVNNLLDFSRIEAGRLEGRFLPTDLGSFVRDIAGLFRPAVERLRLAYHVSIDDREQLVYVDPTLIETVLTNLLSNALKYTQTGSISVRLAFNDATGHAEISVSDTGFGIPAAELSLVTDRFHRASTALSRGMEGTGIGLALAKEIVRLHEGELLIESQTADDNPRGEHGSTFTARLPLTVREAKLDDLAPTAAFGAYGKQVAKEALDWAGDTSNSDSDAGTANDSVTTGSGRSDGLLFEKSDVLLLVDDNPEMRAYIRSIFAPYVRIVEASNGVEALRKARAHVPHLVLSDLMMKELNGQGLLEALRADPATRLVPVVLLSAATDDEVRLNALMAGAEDFLTKPFKPKELLARVHLHMQMGKKRAALEAAFAQREHEIALLSDYCPSGIMRADADGNLTYANTAWRVQAGIPLEPDFDLNEWPQYCDEATRTRLAPVWREILHGDDREHHVSWRWANGRSTSGVFIRLDKVRDGMSGIIGCLTDMTLQEQQLLEAERRRVEAEESKQQQELLVDLTSHEIRTPVSAILQCSSLVKENLVALKEQLRLAGPNGFRPSRELLADLEEDVEALESIYQCGLTQERIAGDVLSLARIQLDMLSLHDVAFDIKKEGRKVFSVFASEAKMKKIDLALDFGPLIGPSGVTLLKTDPTRLGQVVTNLISNAIRFTASSDVRRITVRFDLSFTPPRDDTCAPPNEAEDAIAGLGISDTGNGVGPLPAMPPPEDTPVWLFVSVRDTGPGLGPKELAVLFQRFQQGNKMIHTRYGGSGLGLFICKRITELLGGRIEVRSELGHGSVFRFFITSRTAAPTAVPVSASLASPIPPAVSVATAAPDGGLGSAAAQPEVAQRTADNPMHVLIVEDNIINQTVLKRQLTKAGLTCDTANDGFEALQAIQEAYRQSKRGGEVTKRQYDVILMDLEMPVMDGLTAVREIRESERNGALSSQLVMALTGNARQGQIDQALAAGMDDVVIKPYVLPELLSKMRARVAERRLRAAQAIEEV